jgi:hypothetical protein
MALNTIPVFAGKPDIEWNITNIVAANTTRDGASGTITEVFVANVINGGRVDYLNITPLGTNVATVMRVFINNGLVNTTASNNKLLKEITLPATTLSEVAALAPVMLPLNLAMPAGYKLFVTVGTAVAAGFAVVAVGSDFTPSA